MNSQIPSKNSKNTCKNNSPSRRNRNKSIAIISILFGIVLLIVAFSLIALAILSDNDHSESNSNGTYLFYEADYDYDIMKDKKYLQLDRQVYFENPEMGTTVVITKEMLDEVPNDQKEYVLLLYDYVNYAINGNYEELNGLFSKEYVEAGGKLKMDFTMQQLYNIKITYVASSSEIVDGTTHTSYDYWLEYMIRRNNGTFRSDMESDGARKEYVRVTKRGERLGIDVLSPYTTVDGNKAIVNIKDIIIISILAIACISVFTSVTAYLIKKRKV